ncbi:hypothetical protein [Nonomuraea cavernae]|uniref:Adhesin domain-containing protein n=1 Tax=Nonomuraea cavernae TaxID=2045107 RepID=A0A917YRC3_9ACTN|nr:hypothetical protein [Nonomuraea cavernae]MCA2184810.1 DUF2807 domain-containing protein [Nonomuraea cavernae]GGO64529.1 hypothetical protein GCM10012289_14070 [Nonomuraea cavernae]
MRKVWLVLGAVTTAFTLMAFTIGMWHGFAKAKPPQESTRRSIPFALSKLRLDAERGNVSLQVLPGEAGELVLERSLRWSAEKPAVSEDWDGRTLKLSAVCPGSDRFDPPLCEADYTLYMPPETDLEATTVNGRLDLTELRGDIRATSASGLVRVTGARGDLRIRSGTGDVHADGLTGDHVDVEVGSATVLLSFHASPSDLRAVARAAGDVHVIVPPELTYDVTTDALQVDADVLTDKESPRKITASTPDGDIFLCCR